ncbi:phosphopantetheine-binding protein [Streptomyces sp. NPDC003456]|uniref:phosphopantetheine-binding protein n=1 Tax=Streptomyces sp. NPDC003456 TaxID=3364683 RepID=UPI003680F250
MLPDRPSLTTAASTAPPADLLTDLVAVLAAVLRLKPEKIDPERTFRSLGLDSLLTVEFVATVNARHATAVRADALFDHPTPLAFARHVARERGPRSGTPVGLWAPRAPESPRAPVSARALTAPAVLDVLCEELARIVCCDPWDIDTTAAFHLLGVDSILGAEFVAAINGVYGLRERPAALHDHASLEAMAAHIAATAVPTAPPAAPVQAPPPGPPARPADLGALLDALRDDRISVDEALGLLPPHS